MGAGAVDRDSWRNARGRTRSKGGGHTYVTPPDLLQRPAERLIGWSVGEIRHVLWALVIAVERTATQVLQWSLWRRRHQAIAQKYHYQRRISRYREDDNVVQEQEVPSANAADLSDERWAEVERLMPSAKPRGRPLEHERRALVMAYYYLARTGCGWRQLPAAFPPWQTVHWHVTQWRRAGLLPPLYAILMRE